MTKDDYLGERPAANARDRKRRLMVDDLKSRTAECTASLYEAVQSAGGAVNGLLDMTLRDFICQVAAMNSIRFTHDADPVTRAKPQIWATADFHPIPDDCSPEQEGPDEEETRQPASHPGRARQLACHSRRMRPTLAHSGKPTAAPGPEIPPSETANE